MSFGLKNPVCDESLLSPLPVRICSSTVVSTNVAATLSLNSSDLKKTS
jgi:hypothetical protein